MFLTLSPRSTEPRQHQEKEEETQAAGGRTARRPHDRGAFRAPHTQAATQTQRGAGAHARCATRPLPSAGAAATAGLLGPSGRAGRRRLLWRRLGRPEETGRAKRARSFPGQGPPATSPGKEEKLQRASSCAATKA